MKIIIIWRFRQTSSDFVEIFNKIMYTTNGNALNVQTVDKRGTEVRDLHPPVSFCRLVAGSRSTKLYTAPDVVYAGGTFKKRF